jgi:hypothetical protein
MSHHNGNGPEKNRKIRRSGYNGLQGSREIQISPSVLQFTQNNFDNVYTVRIPLSNTVFSFYPHLTFTELQVMKPEVSQEPFLVFKR